MSVSLPSKSVWWSIFVAWVFASPWSHTLWCSCPSAVVKSPSPWALLSRHSPACVVPLAHTKIPRPFAMSLLHSPEYVFPFDHTYVPCPCILPSAFVSPSYPDTGGRVGGADGGREVDVSRVPLLLLLPGEERTMWFARELFLSTPAVVSRTGDPGPPPPAPPPAPLPAPPPTPCADRSRADPPGESGPAAAAPPPAAAPRNKSSALTARESWEGGRSEVGGMAPNGAIRCTRRPPSDSSCCTRRIKSSTCLL